MLEKAGHTVVWANDKDKYACMTYRHNFPHVPLVEGDIREIDKASIPDFDILAAGFPCQPFSVCGKQTSRWAFSIRAAMCFSRSEKQSMRNILPSSSWRTSQTLPNTTAAGRLTSFIRSLQVAITSCAISWRMLANMQISRSIVPVPIWWLFAMRSNVGDLLSPTKNL